MARIGLALAAAALVGTGCTTVRVVQRDGCWIRQTSRAGNVHEELGPCAAPPTEWSDDRLTRLVQECAARADQRWRAQAVAAFQRGAPPPGEAQGEVEACVAEASRIAQGEAEGLRQRLDDVVADRDAYRNRAEHEHGEREAADRREREALAESAAKLADWLGQAATKPSQPATATALSLSDGRALSASEELQEVAGVPGGTPALVRARARPRPAAPAPPAGPACEGQAAVKPAAATPEK